MLVGDEAFALRPYLMRPYAGRSLDSEKKRVFNYRLSRCRRVIENSFGKFVLVLNYPQHNVYKMLKCCLLCTGILAHRWRILFKPIAATPANVVKLVNAMCVLHNFLRKTSDETYCPRGYADVVGTSGEISDGFWRSQPVSPLEGLGITSRSLNTAGSVVRDNLADYFVTNGQVSWQYDHINHR